MSTASVAEVRIDGAEAVEHRLAHETRDVHRRRAQEDAAAARLEEVDEIRIVAAQQQPQVAVQLAGPALQRLQRSRVDPSAGATGDESSPCSISAIVASKPSMAPASAAPSSR